MLSKRCGSLPRHKICDALGVDSDDQRVEAIFAGYQVHGTARFGGEDYKLHKFRERAADSVFWGRLGGTRWRCHCDSPLCSRGST